MSRTYQQYHDAYYERNFNKNNDDFQGQKLPQEFEIEILKQCYESLEKTLEHTEKEKEHYKVIRLEEISNLYFNLFSNFMNKF